LSGKSKGILDDFKIGKVIVTQELISQSLKMPPGATDGYVMTCLDTEGNGAWQALPALPVYYIDDVDHLYYFYTYPCSRRAGSPIPATSISWTQSNAAHELEAEDGVFKSVSSMLCLWNYYSFSQQLFKFDVEGRRGDVTVTWKGYGSPNGIFYVWNGTTNAWVSLGTYSGVNTEYKYDLTEAQITTYLEGDYLYFCTFTGNKLGGGQSVYSDFIEVKYTS